MNQENLAMLETVFTNCLENIAFMFCEKVEAMDDEAFDTDFARGTISFNGPVNGSITLIIPRDMGKELAANTLGIETSDPAILDQADDAIGELLNVICGQFLTTAKGTGPVFDLTVPKIRLMTRQDVLDAKNDPEHLLLRADDNPVILKLEIENE